MRNLIMIIFLLFSYIAHSQENQENINCEVMPSTGTLSFQGGSICSMDFNQHYNQAPYININVNVHVFNSIPAVTDQTLINRARNFIRYANESLDSMVLSWYVGPNGQFPALVPKTKIRIKLYSDPSNTLDVNNGIWTYPSAEIAQGIDLGNINPIYTKYYGSTVLDVVFINYPAPTNGSRFNNAGVAYLGASNADNEVLVADPNRAASIVGDLGAFKAVARTFVHELGHVLSLNHPDWCQNECSSIDISPNLHCLPRSCTQLLCEPTFNPSLMCPDGLWICTNGASNNITGQGWWMSSITPCQWNRVFNYALNNPRNFIQICPTTSILSLPTSPLVDYRAEQSITSTSQITGNRRVEYYSPLTRLNAGFSVALGTVFMAYPTTFPCCDPVSSSLEAPNLSLLELNDNSIQWKDGFRIVPNPFVNEIKIELSPDNDLFSGKEVRLEIVDLNGKSLHSVKEVNLSEGYLMKTKELLPGMYFLIVQGDNTKKVFPIVKN